MTSPRNSDLDIASAPRTRSSSTSLTGRSHPSLKSDQFSFAFMPLAEGRDPSTSNPVPGRPTPPPAPSHPSCPKFSPRPFSCPYSRPRDTPACIKHSPRPLRTPCNSPPGLQLFQSQSPAVLDPDSDRSLIPSVRLSLRKPTGLSRWRTLPAFHPVTDTQLHPQYPGPGLVSDPGPLACRSYRPRCSASGVCARLSELQPHAGEA